MRRKIEIRDEEKVAKIDVVQNDAPLYPVCFSPQERLMLSELWADYPARRDFLDAGELPHLRFIRWLYRTGRLAP
ncbi:MAG: hypothetical protein JWO59_2501 [Chloroflexi bacterium]|nr:hypothetical protein [Chloroflexota bacterium]